MDVRYVDIIQDNIDNKISFIKKNSSRIATNDAGGLIIYKYMDLIINNTTNKYYVHNIYVLFEIALKLVDGETVITKDLYLNLRNEILILPYGMVIHQKFAGTINTINTLITKTMNYDLIYNLIKRD